MTPKSELYVLEDLLRQVRETNRHSEVGGSAMTFPSVAIGMPYDNPVPMETVLSLMATQKACVDAGIQLEMYVRRCGIVTVARDMVLDAFLQGDAEKLFWVDSDMVWQPNAFLQMLQHSQSEDAVIAAYRRKGPGEPWIVKGLGFAVVDRKVVQALADKAPQASGRARVFRIDIVDGELRGEDATFLADIKEAGYAVRLDPTVTLGHIGEMNYSGRLADVMVR